jgi:hypothetical protein
MDIMMMRVVISGIVFSWTGEAKVVEGNGATCANMMFWIRKLIVAAWAALIAQNSLSQRIIFPNFFPKFQVGKTILVTFDQKDTRYLIFLIKKFDNQLFNWNVKSHLVVICCRFLAQLIRYHIIT